MPEPLTMGLLALGAGAAIKGIGGYLGSRSQASSAREAQERLLRAGREGAGELRSREGAAIDALRSGEQRAQDYYGQGSQILGAQRDELGRLFGQERAVGGAALGRLGEMFLGGDTSAIEQDPGYQFRLREGEKAIQRAASASGSFGSSRNLKDFARFSQGLASQETQAAYGRLMGLAGIGQSATRGLAGLGTSLAQGQAGIAGAQAGAAQALGSGLASTGLGFGQSIANALIGSGSQAAQARMAQGQAQANMYSSITSPIASMATLYGLSQLGGT